MIACYILFSPAFEKFYIRVTQDDIDSRLEKHNNKLYGANTSTAFTNDWEIFYRIECSSFSQAVNIERHIKKMKSKIYITNLKKFPEISQKLYRKYLST
ncbi:MAG: GIY-YIG nuclease family protein [Chitinophagaceae bacterium]|nr:MAG: GIY-YIG nuclease family protein [Chitinophagaceae bacterium]